MTYSTVEIRKATKNACYELFGVEIFDIMYQHLMGKIESELESIERDEQQ